MERWQKLFSFFLLQVTTALPTKHERHCVLAHVVRHVSHTIISKVKGEFSCAISANWFGLGEVAEPEAKYNY